MLAAFVHIWTGFGQELVRMPLPFKLLVFVVRGVSRIESKKNAGGDFAEARSHAANRRIICNLALSYTASLDLAAFDSYHNGNP